MLVSRRSSLVKVTGLLLLGAASLFSYGCSSSNNKSSTGRISCATKPSNCKPGTTCWATSSGGYTCQAAKKGAGLGASCTFIPDQPQCDEGLGCIPDSNGSSKGTCQRFCDNGGCGADQGCFKVTVNGSSTGVPICGPLPPDGGTDSGPPPSDASNNVTSNNDAATEAGSDATSNNDAGSSDAAGD